MREYPYLPATTMRAMSPIAERISTLAKLAWACAALVLAITTLSAFIRLSQAGVGCQPWPQCYGRSAQPAAQEAAGGAIAAARITHRVVAVVALLLIIGMVMVTLSATPVLWREGRMALGLLGLALFLAILGRWTAGARVPAVMLGNLLGGFALFALSCLLAVTASSRRPLAAPAAPNRLSRWAWPAVVLLAGQLVLGGLVSATYAGLSCPELASCDLSRGSWRLLNPWIETPPDPANPNYPAGALVHGLHRAGAAVVAAVLLVLGAAAWREGRRLGAAVIALVLVQVGLGLLQVLAGLPLAIVLAHNVVAALLLAALVMLAAGGDPVLRQT